MVVGAGAKILGPIDIGDGARVAANSVVIEAVPAGATVVGIPGRVVGTQRPTPHGFDLNHHLIPDPVGKAIACLLDRVAALEQRVVSGTDAILVQPLANPSENSACTECRELCCDPPFDPRHPLSPAHPDHEE